MKSSLDGGHWGNVEEDNLIRKLYQRMQWQVHSRAVSRLGIRKIWGQVD